MFTNSSIYSLIDLELYQDVVLAGEHGLYTGIVNTIKNNTIKYKIIYLVLAKNQRIDFVIVDQ